MPLAVQLSIPIQECQIVKHRALKRQNVTKVTRSEPDLAPGIKNKLLMEALVLRCKNNAILTSEGNVSIQRKINLEGCVLF